MRVMRYVPEPERETPAKGGHLVGFEETPTKLVMRVYRA